MRKLAAIVFTDIVGYTALSAQDEEKAIRLLSIQRELLKPIVEKFDGAWMKEIGDGLLLTFSTVNSAVQCAIEIQHATEGIDDYELRIGIHQGDIIEEGGDVFGDDVNVASRIEPFAAPGGIAISQKVQQDISSQPDFTTKYIGQPKLKGIKQEVKVYCITSHGLPETKRSEISAKLERKSSGWARWAVPALVIIAAVSYYLIFKPGPALATSIAVLPLVNLSGDPGQEYFVDGMTEALIAELAQISALRVISRTSVMMYKGARKPLPEIARELNVDVVVEGSVLKAGNRVRITVQLIHGASDEHLWAKDYVRDLKNILALQSDVAKAIAREIKVKLTPQEQTQLASARPVDPEAYEAYLKGRYYWNKRTEEGFHRGLEYFHLAIEKDSAFALAYAGIADCYILLQVYAYLSPKETLPKARAAAVTALEIDPNLAEAHTSVAWVRWSYDLDGSAGEKEFKRALELNPSYATGHHWYAVYLTTMGRHAESLAEIKRALEVDPLSLMINTDLGTFLHNARQYDPAIEQYYKTLEMDKNFVVCYWRLSEIYAHKKMYNEAFAATQKMKELLGENNPLVLGAIGYIYALLGKRDEAQKVLIELSELSKNRYISSMRIALIYMGLGQKEQAFKWLEKGYEERDFWMNFINVPPYFDRLRSDPRFKILLKKMNLELN